MSHPASWIVDRQCSEADYEAVQSHPALIGVFPREQKVFRLFVSSTFQDYAGERNYFAQHVWPGVRAFCERFGWSFMNVDMRWGIRDESTDDHRTVQICLEEIARAQAVSPGFNFLLLLGNRCGWRPLPPLLPARLHPLLSALLQEPQRALLTHWYMLDENNLPPVYKLRPLTATTRQQFWSQDSPTLTAALRAGARRLYDEERITYEELALFNASVTEQEILKGVFGPEEHRPLVFVRDIEGFDPSTAQGKPGVGAFFDLGPDGKLDEEAAALVAELKRRVEKKVPTTRLHHVQAQWQADLGTIGSEHLPKQAQMLKEALLEEAGRQMSNYHEQSEYEIYEERQVRVAQSLGRPAWGDWNERQAAHIRTGLVFGEGQGGRLFVLPEGQLAARGLAWLALEAGMVGLARAADWQAGPAVPVLAHFIPAGSAREYGGMAKGSSAHVWGVPLARQLMALVWEELWAQPGAAGGDWEKMEGRLLELRRDRNRTRDVLQEVFTQLAELKKPVAVILCGANHCDLSLFPWPLPSVLNLIVTLPLPLASPPYEPDEGKSSPITTLPICPLTLTHLTGFLHTKLRSIGRAVTAEQLAGLVSLLNSSGILSTEEQQAAPAMDALVHHAEIAVLQAAEWTSQDGTAPLSQVGDSIEQSLQSAIVRLERYHGRYLVADMLCLLFLAQSTGLPEASLQHALSMDQQLLQSISQYHTASSLPSSVFTRLLSDLAPFLDKSWDHGHEFLRLKQKDLRALVQARYLAGPHPATTATATAKAAPETTAAPSAATTTADPAPPASTAGDGKSEGSGGKEEKAAAYSVLLHQILARVLLPLAAAPRELSLLLSPLLGQPPAQQDATTQPTQQQQQQRSLESWDKSSTEMLELLVECLLEAKEWLALQAMLVDLRYLARRFYPEAIHRDYLRVCRAARAQGTLLEHCELMGRYLMGDAQGYVHEMQPWEPLPDWYPQLESIAPFRHRGSNVIHYVVFPNNPQAAPKIFHPDQGYTRMGWHFFDEPFIFFTTSPMPHSGTSLWTRSGMDRRSYPRHLMAPPAAKPTGPPGRPGQQAQRPPHVAAQLAVQTMEAPHPLELRVFKPFPGPKGFQSNFRGWTRQLEG
eukprot:g2200.t1